MTGDQQQPSAATKLPRAVFLDALSLGPVDLAPLQQWCELTAWVSTAIDERLERLSDAEIAITNKIPLEGELLRQLPKLRLICVAATGTDQIDHAACKQLGISVHNAGRYSRASVVQITWALILELCCAMDQRRRDLSEGVWQRSPVFSLIEPEFDELEGQTLVVLGAGDIGRGVLAIGEAFDMNDLADDAAGVIEALDGLQAMGITCLYLTPIFSSAASHRYHAYDYFQVDPLLGGNAALDALIAAVHQRGMRLVLDGVFNHCGRGFWAFHHLAENGESSPYRNWVHVHRWPIHPYPAAGEDCGYDCWWALPDLPKFNHSDPGVREHLLAVGRHWLERGIDGWRLDVPAEVPADFWVEFRQVVRRENPEAWIVGEVWGDARAWLTGEHFDGVMNYRLGWSSLCWAAGDQLRQTYRNPEYPLNPLSTEALIEIWQTTLGWYRPVVNRAQMNLLVLEFHFLLPINNAYL